MTALTDLAALLPAEPSGDSDWQAAGRAVVEGLTPIVPNDGPNAWTRNLLTGEIEPDPDGDPLYTIVPSEAP